MIVTFISEQARLLILLLLSSSLLSADLRINEFVADNDGFFLDVDGEASDWIELHNPGLTSVSTSGLSLTDDISDPARWPLPDLIVPPGGYLVVFASGKDRRDPAGELHTNFSLSSQGEYLALIDTDGFTPLSEFAPEFSGQFFGVAYGLGTNAAIEDTTFVPWPATGSWIVPDAGTGNAWQQPGFDDTSWNTAQTGIGFGYNFPGFIGPGGNTQSAMLSRSASAYLRIPFQIDNPAEVVEMTLELFYEDGFAAFLNGNLIASANIPSPLSFNSAATASGEVQSDDVMESFAVEFAGKLRVGENILSFQMLNVTDGSNDALLVPMLGARTRDLSGGLLEGYLTAPTPGTPNSGIEFTGLVADTTFDIDRGFFDSPFPATIRSATPGATIVYTTDGSDPTLENGTSVPAPGPTTPPAATVNITTSTVLRTAAFKNGLRPTNIDTQTYLFLDDILDQPLAPEGYPYPWRQRGGGTVPGDFEMDPDVVGTIYSREELKESLRDLPTISIVTDIDNLFDQQTGIQVNSRDSGPGSERRVSVEMIDFEDGPPLQLDAGMRMNGNASRSPNRGKHNFRLAFRNEYGAGRLRFPLFGEEAPTETFNQIILRGGNGNAWVHPTLAVRQFAMYVRDQWFRDAHFEMGYPEALQREVHVYFNGLYFGVHHLFERIEEEWTAERFGGEEDDWEGFRIVGGNNIEVIKGTPSEVSARMLDSWQTVLNAAQAGDLATVEQYLDLDSFIDYLVLNFHAGNTDWDQNNVRAMRQLNPPGKYMFFCHDSERTGLNGLSTGNLSINSITHGRGGTAHRPTNINAWLKTNPEYAIRFADRINKHLFNDGALTPENARAQWEARAERIRLAMKAESAKWGDHVDSTPRTLVDFDNGLNREYDIWFPQRTPISISQFRASDLYPDIDPPVFSQHGGGIAAGASVTITNTEGDIYYTLDGSDPRLSGGSLNPNATRIDGATSEVALVEAGAAGWKYLDDGSDQGAAWRAPAYDDSSWSTGTAPLGFGSVDGHPLGGPEINAGRHLTVYFRKEIEITDANLITEAVASVMSDGGAVVYLNGIEIARDNMPDGTITFSTTSEGDSNEFEGHIDIFTFSPDAFVEGTNVIAVELHNASAGSNDMAIDLGIDLVRLNSPGEAGPLNNATRLLARSFDGEEWSAMTEATFFTATPASAANLIISEIYYNPPGQLETTEYLELMNVSDEAISLAGVVLEGGITFTFTDDATLAPGARLILVADPAAFVQVFGPGLPVVGTYSGQLNNGGENLRLIAANNSLIQDFSYDDRLPWPELSDGDGYSLTLIAPTQTPDGGDPVNWRASLAPGGTPGSSDRIPFTGDTSADLLAYALVDPLDAISASLQTLEGNGSFDDYLVATIAVNTGADDAGISVEFSSDLLTWESGSAVYLGGSRVSPEVTLRHWRAPTPVSTANPLRYARLVLTARP